jgi:hypothetical protein
MTVERIAGHSRQDLVDALCAPAGRAEGERCLREVWQAFAKLREAGPVWIATGEASVPLHDRTIGGESIAAIVAACADPAQRAAGVTMMEEHLPALRQHAGRDQYVTARAQRQAPPEPPSPLDQAALELARLLARAAARQHHRRTADSRDGGEE